MVPEAEDPAHPGEAEIDRLMDVVVQATDYAKRKAAFDRVQDIIAEHSSASASGPRASTSACATAFGDTRPSVLRPHATWNIRGDRGSSRIGARSR